MPSHPTRPQKRARKLPYAVLPLGAMLASLTIPSVWPTVAHAASSPYTVFQYSKLLRSFSSSQAAIAYAKLWDHSRVVNSYTSAVLWDNWPHYAVYQNSNHLRDLTTYSAAVNYAKLWARSKVVNLDSNTIVWANSPHFAVYQYNKELREYLTSDAALPYAKRWDHARIVNLDNGASVWDNWPSETATVREPVIQPVPSPPALLQPFETLDLRKPSDIGAVEIDHFIQKKAPNSPLIGMGSVFIAAQNTYHVNAEYLAAHAILESYYGQTPIAHDKYNLYGYHAYDSDPYRLAAYFSSFTHSIDYEAYFVATEYLDPNGQWYGSKFNAGVPGSTLLGMNVRYASDSLWADKIANIMNEMHPYNAAYYDGVSPQAPPAPSLRPQSPSLTGPIATPTPTPTPQPAPSAPSADAVQYPSGAQGTVTGILLNVYEQPTLTGQYVTTVPSGTTVNVLAKQNEWYQVSIDGKTGWALAQNVELTNVLQVNAASGLNVRTGPGTSFSQDATELAADDHTYLIAKLDANGHRIQVNNWYLIDWHGKDRYVYGTYALPQ